MPERSSKKDFSQTAFSIVNRAVDPQAKPEVSGDFVMRIMREMGRKGGLKGGKARTESLSKEQRTEIAKRGAAARWKKG